MSSPQVGEKKKKWLKSPSKVSWECFGGNKTFVTATTTSAKRLTLHFPHAEETIKLSPIPKDKASKHHTFRDLNNFKASSHDIIVGELSCYTKTELSQIQIHNRCFITNAETL